MNYLDTDSPMRLYEEKINSKIYVDKSMLIDKINEYIRADGKYICITRPRRFGKTTNAVMLGAYYTQGYDSHDLFDHLKISQAKGYESHLNKHHVIYIDFSGMPDKCHHYEQYIDDVLYNLREDIYHQYPELKDKNFSRMNKLLTATNDSFIFILDEWDSIFYEDFMTKENKIAYLKFLKGLLKDQPYVELAYMTGVLPIAKYSSGSELNRHCPPFGVFEEYSFMNDDFYEEYFGFHEDEVKELCKVYTKPTYDELHPPGAQGEVLV